MDKWSQLENIKADKNSTRKNTSTDRELEQGIVKGTDVKGDGTLDLDDFNGNEEQFSKSVYK